MNISEYIKTFPKKDRAHIRKSIASFVGVSEIAVRHWCNGTRKVRPELVLKIECLTRGKVSRHELRPDIYPIANTLAREH